MVETHKVQPGFYSKDKGSWWVAPFSLCANLAHLAPQLEQDECLFVLQLSAKWNLLEMQNSGTRSTLSHQVSAPSYLSDKYC